MDATNAIRLQGLLEHRQSSRAPYDPQQPVRDGELAHIVDAARWSPTAHNMQNFRLVVVDDPALLEQLGELRAAVSPQFIVENYRQLSWSVEELVARRTGLLGTTFPLSWRTDDPARAPANESRPLRDVIAGAPMVIIALFDPSERAPASPHDMLGMISLGCVLENMWLAADVAGLDVQVVSAFSGESVEHAVRRILAVPEPWRIGFALRLGHAISRPPAMRVRRLPEQFVGRNRFR